jgi:Alginate export
MPYRTRITRALGLVAFASTLSLVGWQIAKAADGTTTEDLPPARPPVMFNRWQEDWSVLADTRVPREAFDDLKYISLSANDPHTYLSLGADLRERFEDNDAASFGTGTNRKDDYVISRLEAHADLRVTEAFQAFVQLQSDYAIGKTTLSPVDQDRLDVEEAFVALTEPLGQGTLKVRLGRQQFGFDLQRFVSVRDGPNVRQSYDAAWFDYELGKWRTIAFYSHPVQDRDVRLFDDVSNNRLTYGGFRIERKLTETAALSAYYSRFTQDGVKFPSIAGNERRGVADIRYAGTAKAFDWDLEAMNQTGTLASESIEAWAFGSLAGYTLRSVIWEPRFGIQIDAASGDKNPRDHQLNTFNPLFPNGYYVTLAGYTGFVNFIHLKPSLTLHPVEKLKLLAAVGIQWRETTADAVFTQPDVPVPGTVGHPGRYTGTYGQFRGDWAVTYHVSLALEVVHFAIGDAVREVGGHDSNYVGAEIKYGW